MDRIKKALQKFIAKERQWIKDMLCQLDSGQTANFNIKKLKGRNDIFRVRKGNIRIIYRLDKNGKIFILTIERRKENTYKI
jgi:mRNA-degrading endonuclease RelE of RelBE toxin-antitoxin system